MSKISNVFRTILAQAQQLRGRFTLTAALYTVVGLLLFIGSATAINAHITGETPKELLTRLTQSARENPKVEETPVLGVEETEEEEPTCVAEEVSRKCVGCHRAEIAKQKEDCTTYTEIVDDQSCAIACPQPTPVPVAPQQPIPTPAPTVQEPTCTAREITRTCVDCEQADVTRQREDCSTYAETVTDSSCTSGCPETEKEPVYVEIYYKSFSETELCREEGIDALKAADEDLKEYFDNLFNCVKDGGDPDLCEEIYDTGAGEKFVELSQKYCK